MTHGVVRDVGGERGKGGGGGRGEKRRGGIWHLLEITAGVGVPAEHRSGTPRGISRVYPGVGAVNALP